MAAHRPVALQATGDELSLDALPPGSYAIAVTLDGGGSLERSFEVLPVTVRTIATPALDGRCLDAGYTDGTAIDLGGSPNPLIARLAFGSDGALYACFEVLQRNLFGAAFDVFVAVDVDGSMDASPQLDDFAFRLDQNGLESQWVGDGTAFVMMDSPDPALEGYVREFGGVWTAELRIPNGAVGGLNHLANVALFHTIQGAQIVWPPTADRNAPQSWAAAWFGDTAAPMLNRPPTADAGPDQHHLPNEIGRIALNGEGSADPDGDTLSYVWTQTRGETVELLSSTKAYRNLCGDPGQR